MRINKIKALFKLGIEDLLKNMNVFIYIIMPVGFALLYTNMGDMNKDYIFSLCVLLMLAMVPVALMGTIIAEEKEKNTLRTLVLNDVKATEILVAKALICLLFIVIDNLLMFFIIDLPMTNFLSYQIVCFVVGVAIILFGAVVGLCAKNQMSAGLLSMPFMFILMAPLFTGMIDSKIFTTISSYLPTDAMMEIMLQISEKTVSLSTIGFPIIVILAWGIISIIMFNIVYKKVRVDN